MSASYASASFIPVCSGFVEHDRAIFIPMIDGLSTTQEEPSRLWEAACVLAGAMAVAGLVLAPQAGLLALLGFVALPFLAVVGEVLRGRIHGVLLWWASFFPLRYLLTFPRERAILTPERAVLLLAFIGLFLAKPSTLVRTPRILRRAGLACLLFIAVASLTLRKSPDFLGPTASLFDSFLVPLLFGWCVIAMFDVRRHLSTLHTAVCISSLICAAIAAAEIVTGQDLLPIGNSETFYTGGAIVRPNGPFAANDQLALVGGESFFFLLFLRSTLGARLSTGRRALHIAGLAAALGNSLMPMFRSVALTLLLALIIDTFWELRTNRRAGRVALIAAFVGLIFMARIFAPAVFEERSSAENVYGRVAQYEQSLRVFLDHPALGVGYSNFNNAVAGMPRYSMLYEGVSSVDWPHSNLSSALCETGILGFLPYMTMHVLLLVAMWELRKSSDAGRLVWKYFFYMFLAYWITGLTESSGFEPLNVWYAFPIAVCYKYVLTAPEPAPVLPAEAQLSE